MIFFLSHIIFQAVKHSKNPQSENHKKYYLLNPRIGQYQLGIFWKLNLRGGRVKYAGYDSDEEMYSLVHQRDGCGRRDIRITAVFSPLVNWKVPSKIRNIFGIVQTFGGKMRELTYNLTMNFLMLIVWINIPGSYMCKMVSIIPTNLHWITGIKSRYNSVS